MKAEGKSKLDVRQAKTKSKMTETLAQLQNLKKGSGNQGKIDRLQAKLKVQTARDKRLAGRKAKKETLANYGKSSSSSKKSLTPTYDAINAAGGIVQHVTNKTKSVKKNKKKNGSGVKVGKGAA